MFGDENTMQKYIGELHGKVYPKWLSGYMNAHKIPDIALELRENRLIAHAIIQS